MSVPIVHILGFNTIYNKVNQLLNTILIQVIYEEKISIMQIIFNVTEQSEHGQRTNEYAFWSYFCDPLLDCLGDAKGEPHA